VRPKTIVYFEWIIFGVLLFALLLDYLSLDRMLPDARNPYLAFQIGTFMVIGTLTLLVSRRRSKIAMWISLALFALDVVFVTRVVLLGTVLPIETAIRGLAPLIAKGVAYGLLFTPSARRWMNREDKLLEVFH
jgi:hypothetical protein